MASFLTFVSVILYGAFLLVTVEKAALSQKYESDARDIGQALATLETQYLAASNDLTPDRAAMLGLVTVPSNRIAYQDANKETFSLR
jgi:hypothetical protein